MPETALPGSRPQQSAPAAERKLPPLLEAALHPTESVTLPTAPEAESPTRLSIRGVTAWYGQTAGVRDVSLDVAANTVVALIGPSGCGKSTLLRTLNRMHELGTDTRVDGSVMLDEHDIYAPGVNPIAVRRKIGMVFQKPTPFPTMSIRENVSAGLKVGPRLGRAELGNVIEQALQRAGLWEEVKDRLDAPATDLSGGQQQRLCIARTLAPQPEVVLLDEPTASLDPIGTARIEELVHDLKREYTVVIVTHNMQQAARVSDRTAFFYLGEMIEVGETAQMFTTPTRPQTEAYITGRFG
ncbi:MAG TPA: phosphate ABC transporter ATP-binding protein PstB [Gemmatimonadales bacterium]